MGGVCGWRVWRACTGVCAQARTLQDVDTGTLKALADSGLWKGRYIVASRGLPRECGAPWRSELAVVIHCIHG